MFWSVAPAKHKRVSFSMLLFSSSHSNNIAKKIALLNGERKLPKCFHNSRKKIKNQIYFHFRAKWVCAHTFHKIKDVCFCTEIRLKSETWQKPNWIKASGSLEFFPLLWWLEILIKHAKSNFWTIFRSIFLFLLFNGWTWSKINYRKISCILLDANKRQYRPL